jgi:hypothetical protein
MGSRLLRDSHVEVGRVDREASDMLLRRDLILYCHVADAL